MAAATAPTLAYASNAASSEMLSRIGNTTLGRSNCRISLPAISRERTSYGMYVVGLNGHRKILAHDAGRAQPRVLYVFTFLESRWRGPWAEIILHATKS